MGHDDQLIHDLERELRIQNRTIVRMKQYIKRAAEYDARKMVANGEDELILLRRQLEGMQAALLKAAEAEGTDRSRKRRNGVR